MLHGIVDPFILIPSLPEMIDAALDKYPDHEYEVNDLSSAIFNSFLGIGQICGPLYGSQMTSAFNFRLTCDYVSAFCFVFAFVYLFVAQGIKAFRESTCKDDEKGVPMDIGHSFLY